MCLVSNSSLEIDSFEDVHGNDDRAVVDLRALKRQVSERAAMFAFSFLWYSTLQGQRVGRVGASLVKTLDQTLEADYGRTEI